MKKTFSEATTLLFLAPIFILLSLTITSCQKSINPPLETELSRDNHLLKGFTQVNLVADVEGYNAARIDPTFVNAWGIAFAPSGPLWINTEGTGLSFIFNRNGDNLFGPVTIPSHESPTTGGAPSGIVFNGTSDFVIPGTDRPARFIFVGTDGIISAWNGGPAAVLIEDESETSSYTGLAIGSVGDANFIYAANFKEKKIDVYDKDFEEVETMAFTDPNLPDDYSPFNIQNVGGQLYVMYAKQDEDEPEEEITGPGLGYVDIYNTDGTLAKRFVSKGQLNAPWGVTWASQGFFDTGDGTVHELQNIVLIGNFGDGRINAFDVNGGFVGQLRSQGNPIVIEGLWAIGYSPNVEGSDPNQLFFTAGPDDEEHGLFGYIRKQ